MPNSQRRPFVELDAWKADARAEKASGDVALSKSYAGVFKVEGEGASAPIRIRITTAQRDRSKDTVNPSGWRLEHYIKNPVVLWAHDYRAFPIAKDAGLTIDADGLVGTPQFASADENPWAPYCEKLVRGGYLNAASVGFAPLKWSYNEEERGVDFQEQELLEYSIVPVPDNPGALVEAKRAGIEIGWIAAWAEKALDEWHGGSGLWVPRKAVEDARAIAKGSPLVMLVPKAGGAAFDVLALKEEGPGDASATDNTSGAGAAKKEGGEDTPPCACCTGDCGAEGCACDAGTCGCEEEKCPHAATRKDADGSETKTDDTDEVLVLDEPVEATDDEVIVLEDEPAPDAGKTYDISEAELRDIVRSTLTESLGPALTALTGRID